MQEGPIVGLLVKFTFYIKATDQRSPLNTGQRYVEEYMYRCYIILCFYCFKYVSGVFLSIGCHLLAQLQWLIMHIDQICYFLLT